MGAAAQRGVETVEGRLLSSRARRLKRARRLVRLCARNLLDARDEESALAAIVHDLVDLGGYAGVAIAEAQAGSADARVLVEARHTPPGAPELEDSARGGLIVTALRTGRLGLGRGSVRRLALPIHAAPDARLVLLVEDEREAALEAEENAILHELARDLGLSITRLRDRHRADRLESTLDEEQRDLEAMFQHSREGVFIASKCGTLKFANHAFARLLGYDSGKELLATPECGLGALMAPADKRRLEQALSTGSTSPPVEMGLRRKDGATVFVSVNAQSVRDEQGETWIEGFAQDVTHVREEREAAQRLAAIVDAMDEAVYSKDLSGVILTWNRGAELLYGYSAEEVIGRRALDTIIPRGLEDEELMLLSRIAEGDPVPLFDTQRRAKDGSIIEVATALSPMYDEEGEVKGVSAIAHNIGERKRDYELRLALERQASEVQKLEALAQMRTNFINEAAHELKGPLTPIRTHIHLVRNRAQLDEVGRRGLEAIERNAVRLDLLVRDLLDASRLEAGRLRIDPRETDLRVLVEQAMEAAQLEADEQKVKVKHGIEGPLLLEADAARIRQVITNLILNSVRFSPNGGIVDVRAEEDGDTLTLHVTDHGVGVSQENLDKLFQPFALFERTDPGSSTGLGLFVARGIIKEHGGEMWAVSQGEGQGMRVSFRLPRRPAPPDTAQPADPSASEPPGALEAEHFRRGASARQENQPRDRHS